jgi:parvulin-like peptidyl-prolyl isomerase
MSAFLTINDQEFDLETALRWQMISGNHSFAQETIKNAVILQWAEDNGIEASAEDLQKVFTEFRYALGLESSESTAAWLKSRGLDLQTMQDFCEICALRNRLRASISAEEIQEQYTAMRTSLEKVELYAIYTDTEDESAELRAQIEEGENFLALAKEHSVDTDSAKRGGFIGENARDDLTGEVEAAAFGGKPGDLIGPVKEEDAYALFMVGERILPTLEEMSDKIRNDLFEAIILDYAINAEVQQTALGIVGNPFKDDEDYEDFDGTDAE